MDWLLERTVVSAPSWEMNILQQKWHKISHFQNQNRQLCQLTGRIRWQWPVGSLLYRACIFICKRQRIWLSAWAWLWTKRKDEHISLTLKHKITFGNNKIHTKWKNVIKFCSTKYPKLKRKVILNTWMS